MNYNQPQNQHVQFENQGQQILNNQQQASQLSLLGLFSKEELLEFMAYIANPTYI